jgi:hypothetical protein
MFGGMQRICFGCKILCILYIYIVEVVPLYIHTINWEMGGTLGTPPFRPPRLFFH